MEEMEAVVPQELQKSECYFCGKEDVNLWTQTWEKEFIKCHLDCLVKNWAKETYADEIANQWARIEGLEDMVAWLEGKVTRKGY